MHIPYDHDTVPVNMTDQQEDLDSFRLEAYEKKDALEDIHGRSYEVKWINDTSFRGYYVQPVS
jgi:hypothetical protein